MVETSPRWWLVVGSLRSGGTERQVVVLANELVRRGETVGIALIDGRHAPAYLLDSKVAIAALGEGGALGALRATFKLRRLVRHATIVYSFLDAANLVAATATLGLRTRLIWGMRASDIASSGVARISSRLCRPFSSRVSVMIGNAAACLEYYQRHGYRPRSSTVVHNGIDLSTWRPDESARREVRAELGLPDECVLIGFVARVDPQKRHDLLLQAFARCANAYLVLAGRGTDDPSGAIARQIRSMGLEERVRALGERRDMNRLTAALDIVCCASHYEGFPNSLLEGMACGVCCVASDVGGVREVLGEAGIVVADHTVTAFADALKSVIDDEVRRRELAVAGRKRAEEFFSIGAMTDATVAAATG